MIDKDGVCDCCGQIVKRNKETGKRYTKEELETINNKNKNLGIKFEPKAINTKKSIQSSNNEIGE